MSVLRPTLRVERALARSGARLVAGVDEVGRGALAGPVSVGVVVVGTATRPCPPGLADSKLISPAVRERLEPEIVSWSLACAVGHAEAAEIDAVGIIAAMRRAGMRALRMVEERVGPVDAVLLDGSHDWLTPPQDLFAAAGNGADAEHGEERHRARTAPVQTMVKADQRCASVAAASVLAKCARDRIMVSLAREHPAYGWEGNKGYGAPTHLAALSELGPTGLHRRSWRLPTRVLVTSPPGDGR